MVWVDLEMTGLNIDTEVIMEMACVITDKELNVIAESEDVIIKVEDEKLDNMGEWCQKQHGQSGLTKACRESKITLAQAEDMVRKRALWDQTMRHLIIHFPTSLRVSE